MLKIAPSGSGKSRSMAIPNLARYSGSMIVCDQKGGELTQATALWRAVMLGHEVYVIDPFYVVPDRWLPTEETREGNKDYVHFRDLPRTIKYGFADPLDFIANSVAPLSAANNFAEAMIPVGSLTESHWAEAGQARFAATMMFVKFDRLFEGLGLARNMVSVWRLFSDPELEKLSLKLMASSRDQNIADQANAFLKAGKDNRETQSIRQQIRTSCGKTFNEPAILNTMSKTNIDFGQMSKRPITIYLVIPGNMAVTHNKFMKAFVTMCLGEIERAGLREYDAKRPPTVFMIDEFASLGRFRQIIDGLARFRGFGVKFDLYIQGLSQLAAPSMYGQEWQAIQTNCGLISCFGGTSDLLTAETVSKLCGDTTGVKPATSETDKPGGGNNTSHSLFGRKLILPDDVMRLNLPQQLLVRQAENPCFAYLFEPSLECLPDLVAFQNAISAGKSIPEAVYRAKHAWNTQQERLNAARAANDNQNQQRRTG